MSDWASFYVAVGSSGAALSGTAGIAYGVVVIRRARRQT
jgi:hypothetical protein